MNPNACELFRKPALIDLGIEKVCEAILKLPVCLSCRRYAIVGLVLLVVGVAMLLNAVFGS